MRMQLIKNIALVGLFLSSSILFSQDTSKTKIGQYIQELKDSSDQIEIDILSSYYDQDGEHSAVTGGRGTEDLQDLTYTVIVNIPYKKNIFTIEYGQDRITSASVDNIDTDISSDSKNDERAHYSFGFTRKVTKRKSYHVSAGFSSEYDVTSYSLGAGFALESKNRNSSIDVNAKVYYDSWLLYQPAEFRPGVDSIVLEDFDHDTYDSPNGTDNRLSYNFSVSFAQILTKKIQVALTADFVYQTGLLSTPFHRVYFDDGVNVDILDELETVKSSKLRKRELLPDSRLKIPTSIRFHYYLSNTFIFKGFYRYYYDDFGVTASTVEVELPVRFSKAIAVYPFYRYHTQTAADYFAPFGEHKITDKYFTSDFDLSDFDSYHVGLGFKYTPLFGIGRKATSKKSAFKFKSINFRYAYYSRNDNLESFIISLGLGFTIF